MPIKIHHGPPGSYKTAGAMGDDFLREAKAGRVIVTNVRGVSRDRCLDVFPDLPETFDVIHVDDSSQEGRDKWAKWFHWVPKGAYIFVDEGQDVWPKRWRDADLKLLDYPGGVDQATKDDRPYDWAQAWDKHRHWNWDVVITTPQYAKIRDDIKGVADAAYKHKDLALIGWAGNYIEAMHLADDTGKSTSDFQNIQKKKVPAYVFKLYDSTATGVHRKTANGFNLFASPRIMVLLAVLFGSLYLGFSSGPLVLFPGAPSASAGKDGKKDFKPAVENSAPSGSSVKSVSSGGSGIFSGGSSGDVVKPFDGEDVYIRASYKSDRFWKYSIAFAGTDFTSDQILDMGYTIQSRGSCGVVLSQGEWQRFITCGVPKNEAMQAQKEKPPSFPVTSSSEIRVPLDLKPAPF